MKPLLSMFLLVMLLVVSASGVSAVTVREISVENCGFSSVSPLACDVSREYVCDIVDTTGATSIRQVVYTIGNVDYVAVRDGSGTVLNDSWSVDIVGSAALLGFEVDSQDIIFADAVSVQNAAFEICSGPVVATSEINCGPDNIECTTTTGCFMSFTADQSFAQGCFCEFTESSVCGIDNLATTTFTPSTGCSAGTEAFTSIGTCDFCDPGFIVDSFICEINRSEGDGLTGSSTLTFSPTDGGACCTTTGLASDCTAPLTANSNFVCSQGFWISEYNDVSSTRKNAGSKTFADESSLDTVVKTSTEFQGRQLQPIVIDYDDDGVVETIVFTNNGAGAGTITIYDPDLNVEQTINLGRTIVGDAGVFEFDARQGFSQGYKDGTNGIGIAVIVLSGTTRMELYRFEGGSMIQKYDVALSDATSNTYNEGASVFCDQTDCFTVVGGNTLVSVDKDTGAVTKIAFPSSTTGISDLNWRNMPAKVPDSASDRFIIAKGFGATGAVSMFGCNTDSGICTQFNMAGFGHGFTLNPANVTEIYLGPKEVIDTPVFWSENVGGRVFNKVAYLGHGTTPLWFATSNGVYESAFTGSDAICAIAPAAAECPADGIFFASSWIPASVAPTTSVDAPVFYNSFQIDTSNITGSNPITARNVVDYVTWTNEINNIEYVATVQAYSTGTFNANLLIEIYRATDGQKVFTTISSAFNCGSPEGVGLPARDRGAILYIDGNLIISRTVICGALNFERSSLFFKVDDINLGFITLRVVGAAGGIGTTVDAHILDIAGTGGDAEIDMKFLAGGFGKINGTDGIEGFDDQPTNSIIPPTPFNRYMIDYDNEVFVARNDRYLYSWNNREDDDYTDVTLLGLPAVGSFTDWNNNPDNPEYITNLGSIVLVGGTAFDNFQTTGTFTTFLPLFFFERDNILGVVDGNFIQADFTDLTSSPIEVDTGVATLSDSIGSFGPTGTTLMGYNTTDKTFRFWFVPEPIYGGVIVTPNNFTEFGCYTKSQGDPFQKVGGSIIPIQGCPAQMLSADVDRDGTDEIIFADGIYEYINAQQIEDFGNGVGTALGVVDFTSDSYLDFVFITGTLVKHLSSVADLNIQFSEVLTVSSLSCVYTEPTVTVQFIGISAQNPDFLLYSASLFRSGNDVLVKSIGAQASPSLTFNPGASGSYRIDGFVQDPFTGESVETSCEFDVLVAPEEIVSFADISTDLACSIAPAGEFNYDSSVQSFDWFIDQNGREPQLDGSKATFNKRDINMLHGLACRDQQMTLTARIQPTATSNFKLIAQAEDWFYAGDNVDWTTENIGGFWLYLDELWVWTDAENPVKVKDNLEAGRYYEIELLFDRSSPTYSVSIDGAVLVVVNNWNGRFKGEYISVIARSLEGVTNVDYIRTDGVTNVAQEILLPGQVSDDVIQYSLQNCRNELVDNDFRNFTANPVGNVSYNNVRAYCDTVAAGSGSRTFCEFDDLKNAIRINPDCYQEAFTYCVEVTFPLTGGFQENVENVNIRSEQGVNLNGAAACSIALSTQAAGGSLFAPLWNLMWSATLGNPIFAMVIMFVLVIGVAIYAKTRK